MIEQRTRGGMSKFTQAVIVLTLICLGSGLGVGMLYHNQRAEIEANERNVFLSALAEVLGEAEDYPTVGEYEEEVRLEDRVYMRRDDEKILYAAMGSAPGYQSPIRVLVSVRADTAGQPLGEDPVIHRLAVVSSQETPGLGEQIRDVEQDISIWAALVGRRSTPARPWFQEQFSGRRLGDLVVERTADTDKIAAVTGATETSKAATEAARQAVERTIERTAEVYGG